MALAATAASETAWTVCERLLRQTRAAVPSPALAADLADAALTAGREAEALPVVAAAARRHDVAALWQWLGLLQRALDRQEDAIAAFQKAVQRDPRNARAMLGLAQSAFDAGLPASPLFERAALLAPTDSATLRGRADAHVAEGRPDRALAELEVLLGANPGWIDGHRHIAHIRWMTGDRAGFLDALEGSLAQRPGHVALWQLGLDLLIEARLTERASAWLARARHAVGPAPLFDAYAAIIAGELGADADPLFAALSPIGDIGLAVYHVRHLLRSGRAELARAAAERWLDHPDARLMLPYAALAWRQLGDPRVEWLEGDARLVGVYDIADQLPPLDALAAHLGALHAHGSEQLDQSVRGGTQTVGPLLSRIEPIIQATRRAIIAAVESHIAQLPPRDPRHPTLAPDRDAPVRFAGSWSVRFAGAGHHASHLHTEGWLSSALYVAVPDAAARGPAPAGWLTLGEAPAELGLDLAPTRMIEPKPGRLVLFPATMWHGTRPFAAGERMTIAFDVARPIGR
ncbi:MAG: hypothetical protein JOY99_17845 [Sphingomonadaceae bacterium]|nr:hypothetical protein [Sphingomonadaceae bacterium]